MLAVEATQTVEFYYGSPSRLIYHPKQKLEQGQNLRGPHVSLFCHIPFRGHHYAYLHGNHFLAFLYTFSTYGCIINNIDFKLRVDGPYS